MGEYSNFPAEYAEVSTFRHTPISECSPDNRNNSPAPYATSSIVNTSARRTNNYLRHNSHSNMYFTNDLYPLQTNRTIHSDTYFNPNNEMINITENKLCNGMYTYNPNMSVPQTPTATKRAKKRLKLDCMIQSRLDFGNDDANNQYHHHHHHQQEQHYETTTQQNPNEQLYVKVGECSMAPLSSEVYINCVK